MAERFTVPLLYAGLDEQFEESVVVSRGQTVADAVAASPNATRVVAASGRSLSFAIFGQTAAQDAVLQPGDRVELLRPLTVDPKEARRRRARR